MSYIIKIALDIKARFESPAPMTSPLEAYCAIGTTARAMKLGLPERKDTLSEMWDQLDVNMGNSESEDGRIAGIHTILRGSTRNGNITDQMTEYVTYDYKNER